MGVSDLGTEIFALQNIVYLRIVLEEEELAEEPFFRIDLGLVLNTVVAGCFFGLLPDLRLEEMEGVFPFLASSIKVFKLVEAELFEVLEETDFFPLVGGEGVATLAEEDPILVRTFTPLSVMIAESSEVLDEDVFQESTERESLEELVSLEDVEIDDFPGRIGLEFAVELPILISSPFTVVRPHSSS